jgi:hypothetical protein
MISDSSAMARMAANFVLALAVRQNARSFAKDLPLGVRPQLHCIRRCLAALSWAHMREDYHVGLVLVVDDRPHKTRRTIMPRVSGLLDDVVLDEDAGIVQIDQDRLTLK